MSKPGYYLFSVLCENITIDEASEVIKALKNVPGAKDIGRFIHKEFKIPHDYKFFPTDKIELGKQDRYDYASGRWYIIAGTKGSAGLQYANNSKEYKLVVKRPSDERYSIDNYPSSGNDSDFMVITSKSGKGIMSQMRELIGKPVEYFHNKLDASIVGRKKVDRKNSKDVEKPLELSLDTYVTMMFNKFRPTFLRVLKNAEAEYRGLLNIQIKNQSYEKAQKKLEKLQKLDNLIKHLEVEGTKDLPEGWSNWLRACIGNALALTAGHYYPDETGDIETNRWGNREYQIPNEARQKVLNDIKNGDAKKLSTMLSYFKNQVLLGASR